MKESKLKKVFAAAVAAVCMASSLASCGSSSDKNDSKKETSTTTTAAETSAPDESVPELTLPTTDESEPDTEPDTKNESDTSDVPYTPAAWKITSPGGNVMYMMGSMHALKDECTPLPDYVTDMYNDADTLAVEVDISDTTSQVSLLLNYTDKMTYPDGKMIADHIGEDIWNNVSGYLELNGIDPNMYSLFQAWYVLMLLENVPAMQLDLQANNGLDMQLLTKAHEENKEIYEVETAEFQLDLLSGYSENVIKTMMSGYSAENNDLIKKQMEDVYIAWKSGDLAAFENSDEESMEAYTEEERASIEEYNKLMITDRNIGMAEKAMELIDGDKKVFYVVGLAHFTGEGGILKLLEEKGCTVERVDPTATN